MHKARAFFYVAAGVFLLALCCHLGARNAGAQVGSQVTLGDMNRSFEGGIAAVVNRSVYTGTIRPKLAAFGALPPVPGVDPIVAVYGADPTVMLFNGDVYTYSGGGWTLMGNIVSGGRTPAQQGSWGAVKDRYRGERGVGQPALGR
jgi:hypothetical protein